MPGISTQVSYIQGKCPTYCTIALAPDVHFKIEVRKKPLLINSGTGTVAQRGGCLSSTQVELLAPHMVPLAPLGVIPEYRYQDLALNITGSGPKSK